MNEEIEKKGRKKKIILTICLIFIIIVASFVIAVTMENDNGNNIEKEFRNYNETDGLLNNRVYSFESSANENIIYIGTGLGISIFNLNTETFTNIEMIDGQSARGAFSLEMSAENNELYIGSHPYYNWSGTIGGGLHVYNLNSNEFAKSYDFGGTYENSIDALLLDHSMNTLYVGTGNGLKIINLSNDTHISKTTIDGLPHQYVTSLVFDEFQDILYIGTSDGICRYDVINNTISIISNIPSNLKINSLALNDNATELYIGTDTGILIYNPSSFQYRWLTIEQGLPNNKIKSLVYVNSTLYIGTIDGFCIWNPQGEGSNLTSNLQIFNIDDGLPEDIIYSINLSGNRIFIGTENEGFSIYE